MASVSETDKMAAGYSDRSADIMYIDGSVGPHVEIFE